MAEPEGEDYEGDDASDYQDGAQQVPEDVENFSDEPEDAEEYEDPDPDWNESSTNNFPHSILNATSRISSTNTRAFPSDPQEEIPIVLEREEPDGLDPDSISLRTDSEKAVTMQRVGDSIRREHEHNRAAVAVSGAQREHASESSMSAEQRIKRLEEKVAELNALRRLDSSSISRLTQRAETAFDNMSVLLSRVRMHRQELGAVVTKHIEPAHQKPFKSLIDKMDETSVSATQILVLLDKRKNYVIPKSRVPVIITDEDGQEWVPWDVISDDNILEDAEMEKKRRRDSGANGEGSSKRRKC